MSALRLKKHPILRPILLLLIAWVGLTPLIAQDANYWTHQYGTRSTLLGGAVIGSVLDLSGTYYNPGGVALVEEPAIIEAAKVFQYPSIMLKGLGQGDIDLSTSTLEPAPSLLAGTISLKGLGNHWLGYALGIGIQIFELQVHPWFCFLKQGLNMSTLKRTFTIYGTKVV